MGIITRLVLKNICEKKMRSFLIIFSITVSSALFLATGALNGTMEKMYVQRLKSYYGTADIMIQAGDHSPSPRFNPQPLNPYKEQMEYIVGILQGTVFYKDSNNETVQINMLGVDWDEYQFMNPIILYSENNILPFSGRKVVIGKDTADKYGIRLGDKIEFEVNGDRQRFDVCALAQPSGPFLDQSRGVSALVPKETLGSIYNEPGRVSLLLIKLKNPEKIQATREELAQTFKLYAVKETVSTESLNRQVKPMRISFAVTSIIVFLMSIFIISTSFKVITTERLPVIGTLRNIGATQMMTNLILLAESLVYGLTGGIFGGGLGIGLLYIIMAVSTPPTLQGIKTTLEFSPLQLLATVLMAVILSLISSGLPILKAAKIPVKDIVLNNIQKETSKKTGKLIIAVMLIVMIWAVPPLIPKAIAIPVNTLFIILSFMAIVWAIPFITAVFARIFASTHSYLFGNEGILAAQNLRDNKSALNNISLLAIGVSSILMINTMSYSVIGELSNYFADMKYDIYIEMPNLDRNFAKHLQAIQGTTGTYGLYTAKDVNVAGSHEPIGTLDGIDKNKHLEYFKLQVVDGNEDILEELDSGRNIILNSSLGYRYQKKQGDLITLEFGKGPREYRIIGFINTLMEKGDYAMISENYFKMDTGERNYGYIVMKTTNDPAAVVSLLKKKYIDNKPYVQSLNADKQDVIKTNQQIFSVLKGFSFMTIVMGILGVFNNYLISFIERKRVLAMLRSLGMSKRQIIKMIFIEAMTGGLIGGIVGVGGGVLMVSVFPYIMKALDMPIPISYAPSIVVISILASIVITLVVSISPALKSSRLNIIESIKYE